MARRQHVLSQVLLGRFTGADGRLVSFNKDFLSSRFEYPAAVGYVRDFIVADARESEQRWSDEVETHLPAAFEALEDGTLFREDELVQVVRKAIALHWARALTARDIWHGIRTGKLEELQSHMSTKFTYEEAFRSLYGLYPPGPATARRVVEEYITEAWEERFSDGRFFRDRVHENFDTAQQLLADRPMQIGSAQEGEFLIGDRGALTIKRGHPGGGPLQGIRWGEDDAIVLPLGPHHVVGSGRPEGFIEMDQSAVDGVNLRQVNAARSHVFFRPGSGLGAFVKELFVGIDGRQGVA